MSSQMRYRTPMATSLAFSPTPTMPSTILPPPQQQTPQQPPPQPIHRYTTPSAFAQHPGPLPQGPSSSTGYPSTVSYVQQPLATGSSGMQFDPYGGRGSRGGSVMQPTPTQRAPLERVVEATQTSLAALSERMDALEAGVQSRTPPHASLQVSRSRVGSPQGGPYHPGVPEHPFDPHQTGAWSIILVPLSSVFERMKLLFHFLIYPPDSNRHSTRLIIIRRLLLDASFAISVLAVLRALWRATGIRRREVLHALVGVWHAIAGKSSRRTRVLVDKAVDAA